MTNDRIANIGFQMHLIKKPQLSLQDEYQPIHPIRDAGAHY